MRVTFLEATNGLRLTKHYGKNKVTPYPYVKEVTSHEHQITLDQAGLNNLYQLIKDHGEQGHCMLKGGLKRQLVQESRKGQSERNALNALLVLDVDGIKLNRALPSKQLSAAVVESLTEQVINTLPPAFHDVSYISQASSSLGMKGDKVSLHIFMLLTVPMPPKSIKLWLQHANLSSDLFKPQIELSSNGQSLKYPLDVSLADNSKLVFISTPTFDDPSANPFVSDDDRTILITRGNATVDLAAEMGSIHPEIIHQQSIKHKDELRVDAGMKRKNGKVQSMTIDHEVKDVLTNPDRMHITVVDSHSFPFVRCNINNGDSAAYYFNAERPIYMYNFKDEPLFEIEKADPDFYKGIFDMFEEEMKEIGKTCYPVVLRDYHTDMYFNGVFDPNLNQFTEDYPLTQTSKTSIESFMLSHGRAAPDFVPDARIIFDPTKDDIAVNLKKVPYYVNTYTRSKYMLEAIEPDEPLEFGYARNIQDLTPNVFLLIDHILGNGQEEFERFINWMAYIYQTRQKTKTSWVLSGTQGTGKGLFYNTVIKPLFTEQQAPMRALESIEEQFNLFMRNALFLVVDEFHMGSAKTGTSKIADKLKNWIAEKNVSIRAMRSNSVQVESYCNFLFFTNRLDAVKIDTGDRRYNIAPRQETKLLDAHPDLPEKLYNMDHELRAFAGVLSTFKYEERFIHVPIDNRAKEQMRNVGMSVFEEFCKAIRDGDLNHFADILDINTGTVAFANEIMTAQRFVKKWVAEANDPYVILPTEHLRTVFHIQTEQNPRLSQREFIKRLQRHGLEITRKRPFSTAGNPNQSVIRGIETKWHVSDKVLTEIIDTHFQEEDRKLLRA